MRGRVWQLFVSLVALALIGVVVIYLGRALLGALSSASPGVVAALVSGVALLCVAGATYLFDRAKTRADAHRQQKVIIYTKFVNMLFGMFFREKIQELNLKSELALDDAGIMLALFEFKRDVIFWSSPSVVNAFTKYLQLISSDESARNMQQQGRYISLCLKAMRSDVGLSNVGLSDDFFIEWIIQDPKELAQLRQQAAVRH